MELREFADGMKQQEQLDYLEQRLRQLVKLVNQKASDYEQASDAERIRLQEEIEQIELLNIETEEFAEQFAFNELVFGFPVSNAVVELYERSVLNPYAEY